MQGICMHQLDKAHILVVDDSATIRNSITRYLGEDYIVLHAENGEEAWRLIRSNSSICLVFADLHMPVMNGMALLSRIRGSKNNRITNLPVIMITGHEDTDAAKRASYNLGASDFISKPFSEIDILSRVDSYVKLSQKIANLEQNVSHDDLTKLYNTSAYNRLGEQAVASALRHEHDLSLITMQISNIEDILKQYGKKITSQIIIAVANSLRKSLRKEESLAHLGMGQFSMLLPMTKAFRAQIVAQRFQKTVSSLVFKIGNESIRIHLGMGINSLEGYSSDINFKQLTTHTELAMQTSLTNPTLKLMRYDPANGQMVSNKFIDTTSFNVMEMQEAEKKSAPKQETAKKTEFEMKNTAAFSRYMSMILNRNFSKIPKEDIRILVEPLREFLQYVDENELSKNQAPETN